MQSKRVKILLFLSLFISYEIFCQSTIGLRAGTFFSKIEYSSNAVSDKITGLDIGIISKIALFKGIYIQPEIGFLQKGGFRQQAIDDVKINFNQLEAATLLGYQIDVKKIIAFVNIGISVGRILEIKTEGNPYINFDYVNIIDDKTDWGYIYGGGIGFKLGRGNLFTEYRYRHSNKWFRTIIRGDSPAPEDTLGALKIKSYGWGLSLKYLFVF